LKADAEVKHDGATRNREERRAGGDNGAHGVAEGPLSLLRLQRQAGNAAVTALMQRRRSAQPVAELSGASSRGRQAAVLGGIQPVVDVAAGVVQREVTTTMSIPGERDPVDIAQISNREIEDAIDALEGESPRTAEQDEQIAFARNYLAKRLAALADVDAWEAGAPDESPHFKGVKKRDVAHHLEVTIEEPHLINQDEMNWCGPNDFLMIIARNDPAAYAAYVTGLYTSGRSMIGAMEVKPGAAVKGEWESGKVAEPADWMALGSLRDAGNWFWSATDETIGFATFPGDIKGWFAQYGVPKDKIIQRGGFIARTDANDLREANTLFGSGWNVLLWMHVFTVRWGGHDPKEITMFDIQKTHWVVMDSPFTQTGDRWESQVNTWGGKGANKMEVLNSKISSSVFGFIAVDMRAQAKKPAPGAAPAAAAPVH
jgi:hypothetical protein